MIPHYLQRLKKTRTINQQRGGAEDRQRPREWGEKHSLTGCRNITPVKKGGNGEWGKVSVLGVNENNEISS